MADIQNLTAEQKDVLNALQQPVSNETISDAHIGIFSLKNANLGTTTHINPNASIENWRNDLTRDTRVLNSKDISEIDKELNNKYKGEVAHAKEGVINLPNYEMNEQVRLVDGVADSVVIFEELKDRTLRPVVYVTNEDGQQIGIGE